MATQEEIEANIKSLGLDPAVEQSLLGIEREVRGSYEEALREAQAKVVELETLLRVSKGQQKLRIVDVYNAYEHDVTAMEPGTVYGDALEQEKNCPEDCVMIVDAEMELVAFVPADKGQTLEVLLNWVAVNYQ